MTIIPPESVESMPDRRGRPITKGRPTFWVALAAILVAAVSPRADAAIRFASPDGLDGNDGSAEHPWSLDRANGSLAAGDVCYLLPGIYSAGVRPGNAGVYPGLRISFVGDLADPAKVVVADIAISTSWISVKGVAARDLIILSYDSEARPAHHDSIAYCIGQGLGLLGAKHCVVARCRINGPVSFMQDRWLTGAGISNCEADTLRRNTIALGVVPGSHGFKLRGFTQRCVIDSNRVSGTFTQDGHNDGVGRIFYNTSRILVRDNSWRFDATTHYNPNHDPWNGFVLRDSTRQCRFERDTVLLGLKSGPYQVRGVISGSGSYPGSVGDNVWRSCVFRTNSTIWVQDGLRRSVIENSTFASPEGPALSCDASMEQSQIRRCTFWAGGQAASFGSPFVGAGNEITSNIFYSLVARPMGNGGAVVQYAADATKNFVANRNLYFAVQRDRALADRAIEWCCFLASRPGRGSTWFRLNGQDGDSRYGSPRFVDSTFARLDLRLGPGSAAIGLGADGSDAGALPFRPARKPKAPSASR